MTEESQSSENQLLEGPKAPGCETEQDGKDNRDPRAHGVGDVEGLGWGRASRRLGSWGPGPGPPPQAPGTCKICAPSPQETLMSKDDAV